MLRLYGNMSSAFVYFVLQAALRTTRSPDGGGCHHLAPGFSCHGALLKSGVTWLGGETKVNLKLLRRVEPELLDGLAAEDPRAQRSRNDLRRIHRAMATLSILQRALDCSTAGFHPTTLLELGAGDGTLMLRLAQRRAGCWPDVHLLCWIG